MYLRHHARTRIGNRRRARIGDQRDALTTLQSFDDVLRGFILIVFMCGNQRFLNAILVQQGFAVARILASDGIDFG